MPSVAQQARMPTYKSNIIFGWTGSIEHRCRTEIRKPASKIADSWSVVKGILRAPLHRLVVVA
jgi:hypothetical protein